MSFRMQLASLPLGAGPYVPLCFATQRRGANAAIHSFNPVLASTVGSELEYGNLFAYLFRRFGYPNQAWDHATELARYLLTTPHPALFLSVMPRIDGRTDDCIDFLAPAAAGQAAASFARGAVEAWEARAIAHRAASGMPEWLRARKRTLAPVGAAAKGRTGDAVQVWREALRVRPTDSKTCIHRVQGFLRRCQDEYARIEAKPPLLQRAVMVKAWAESDPLKPYALAAARALEGFTREVRVGANAIDVFGPKPRTARALVEAASVALGHGGLLNRQGARLSQLLQLVASLGGRDQRLGLEQAIAVLRQVRAN